MSIFLTHTNNNKSTFVKINKLGLSGKQIKFMIIYKTEKFEKF